MKVLFVQCKRQPIVMDVKNDLSALQNLVGGYIEVIQPWNDDILLICNEEGKIRNECKLNRIIQADGGGEDAIFGDFFLCGYDGCEFTDFPESLVAKYTKKLALPWGRSRRRENND